MEIQVGSPSDPVDPKNPEGMVLFEHSNIFDTDDVDNTITLRARRAKPFTDRNKILNRVRKLLGLKGNKWENDDVFAVGDFARDVPNDTYWRCLEAHTAPSTGTFEDDRTANPSRWVETLPSFDNIDPDSDAD